MMVWIAVTAMIAITRIVLLLRIFDAVFPALLLYECGARQPAEKRAACAPFFAYIQRRFTR